MSRADRPPPDMPNDVPRPEYPRPGFVRADWLNRNGTWRFAFDPGDEHPSGEEGR
jgi:hypothetical protein